MINYYKNLWIDNFSDLELVKKTYRKLAMTTHPDMGWEEKRFIEINESYEKLKDISYKATYDKLLKDYLEELNKPKEPPKNQEQSKQHNNTYNSNKSWYNSDNVNKNNSNVKDDFTSKNSTKKQEKTSNVDNKKTVINDNDDNEKSDEYYKDFTKENYEKYKSYFYNSKNKNNSQNYQDLEYEEFYEEENDDYEEDDDGDIFDVIKDLFRFIWKIFRFFYKIFKYFMWILKYIFSKKFVVFLKESYNFKWKIWRTQLLKRLIWWFILFCLISRIPFELGCSSTIIDIIWYPILLFYIIFAMSNLVKRYNDFWKNKRYMILLIIPYINLIFLLFLLFKKWEKY